MLVMGKSTISMAIFHCYVSSPERNSGVYIYIHKWFYSGFTVGIYIWNRGIYSWNIQLEYTVGIYSWNIHSPDVLQLEYTLYNG